MLFEQKTNYQKISGHGKGRDCEERWNYIKEYIISDKNSKTIDIGSAEGYFSRKIAERTGGIVVSIEGSSYVATLQKAYNKDLIDSGNIHLHETILTPETLKSDFQDNYNYCVLLSVLHWFKEPDTLLKGLSEISEYIFFEIPELHDEKSWNQSFMKRLKCEYVTIENYIKSITNMNVIDSVTVGSHMPDPRTLYVLSK